MNAESDPLDSDNPSALSRRRMLQISATLVTAQLTGVSAGQPAAARIAPIASGVAATDAATRMPVQLNVNGRSYAITVDTRTTVLDALRENLGLKGTKKGCDHGQCGACTVLIDGRRINACLSLAVMHDGQSITSIEGLASDEVLHPMQTAFMKHDGFQCGYCTPGQICSSIGMLNEARMGAPSHVTRDLEGRLTLTDEEIRERMSGNLCRCSAYPNIVAAIRDAAGAAT